MKQRFGFIMLLCLLWSPWAVGTRAQSLGMGVRAGTLGPGLEATTALGKGFNARLGAHYLTYSHSDVLRDLEVDVAYTADLTLTSAAGYLDWHPFRNSFRLTTGAIFNGNTVDAVVTPIEAYTIDDRSFSPARIGTLTAKVDYENKVSPYLGFGFGNAVQHRAGIAFDLGLMYTAQPHLVMQGSGMIAPTADQAGSIEEGFRTFRFYPVFSLGLNLALLKQ